MAKSAISIDVQAANSKLAKYLHQREEEEGLLQIGKRKVREAKHTGGRQMPRGRMVKWRAEPDFSYPTPMVDRPRTTSGSTSFHFSFITVSKQGSATIQGRPLDGMDKALYSPGAEHSKYIERDGAAERTIGSEHAAYIERDGAVEGVDPTREIAEGIERTIAAVVNEAPLRDEAEMLGLPVDVQGVPSIFSNISDDAFEREGYWRAVHRIEREPRTHEIIVDPEASPEWWDAIETSPHMHQPFREHCLLVREQYRLWLDKERNAPTGKPFDVAPWRASSEGCGKAIDGARKTAGWNYVEEPLEFKSGRGGRVQFRFVAELPHEITPQDRALIVQNFCDHLATIGKDENGQPIGMMYTAVIHAPDAHNDRRNFHLHLIAHDRPARFLPEHNQWDFEIAESFDHKGEVRVRWPYRQPKIGEVTRAGKSEDGAKKDSTDIGIQFIPARRRKFASITNTVLEARGIERRYDARKYEDMGIDRTPTEHLGTKAAALEAIGVPTVVGKLNAVRIWHDAERAIEKRARAVDAALNQTQRELTTLIGSANKPAETSASMTTLRTLTAERAMLIADVAEDRRMIMTFDHLEAKAKSRAVRTRQTCLHMLSDLEKSAPTKSNKALIREIQKRWKEAQSWIEAIDRDLAPDRSRLAQAADDVRRREERIREIDALLAPIRTVLAKAGKEPEKGQLAEGAQSPRQKAKDKQLGHTATATAEKPRGALEKAAEPMVPVASLEPVAVEGLPIVSPTIDPKSTPLSDKSGVAPTTGTPEGLNPLRPRTDKTNTAEPTRSPSVDLTPSEPKPSAPTADKRRKETEPTLYPVQAMAPIKPGTSKAAHADWNNLLNQVSTDRVMVTKTTNQFGKVVYDVPSLNEPQQAIVRDSRFETRTIARLGGIYDFQRREIERLVRWIDKAGRDPSLLILEDRKARLGATPQSIRELFKHWGAHPTVKQALGQESERRAIAEQAPLAAAKARADAMPKAVDPVAIKAARAAEIQKLYSSPDRAETVQVHKFLELIHAGASPAELQVAADLIRANPIAREEIHRHGLELSHKYNSIVEDAGLRTTRDRDRRGGR